jgi:hypothetical protein
MGTIGAAREKVAKRNSLTAPSEICFAAALINPAMELARLTT